MNKHLAALTAKIPIDDFAYAEEDTVLLNDKSVTVLLGEHGDVYLCVPEALAALNIEKRIARQLTEKIEKHSRELVYYEDYTFARVTLIYRQLQKFAKKYSDLQTISASIDWNQFGVVLYLSARRILSLEVEQIDYEIQQLQSKKRTAEQALLDAPEVDQVQVKAPRKE